MSNRSATISCGNRCQAEFAKGTSLYLMAYPAADSQFVGWNRADCPGIRPCGVTVDGPLTVEARFDRLPAHSLRVTVSGPGT